ncbi:MAG: SRPBCC family protein [Chitinophagaceae bacterium]
MKTVRLLFFFLLAVVIITVALSFIQPTSQKVEREIVINTPPSVIYEQLIKLEHFHQFSVWSQQDSSAVYSFTGVDGTVGATSSWKGSPEISGEGKIEIIKLEPNKKVQHQLHFTKPRKGDAVSTFTLSQNEKSSTTVKWVFELATPRPWNIFNLISSLDKKMGDDFETGLLSLKTLIELNNALQTEPSKSN